MRLILASNNQNKLREFKDIFGEKYNILSLNDLNINIDPEETGITFRENAYIKAKAIRDYMKANNILEDNDIIISDDSGFEISALDNQPGIYSARFLGDVSYKERFEYILNALKNKKDVDRKCDFKCTICMIQNDDINYFEGRIDGEVATSIKGENGFGYDPIFYLPDRKMTIAELPDNEKNMISHRARAIAKLYDFLKL